MSIKPPKLENIYSDQEFYEELRNIGILSISREVQYNLLFPEHSTVAVNATGEFLLWIEEYLYQRYLDKKEEKTRSEHPSLQKAWDDYHFLLKLCRSPNG